MPLVDVGGYELSVTVQGAGQPVVFIAGLGEPGANWSAVLARLQASALTVTYDRAGIGDSDPFPERTTPQRYSFFAGQLDSLLRALDLPERVVVVGHSFGCLVARVFASLWPQRVAGLVLVEASVPEMSLWSGDQPYIDGDGPDAIQLDTDAGSGEVVPLSLRVPSVVMTRTPGRWSTPRATPEVDSYWRRQHRRPAAELDALHVMAGDAGHRLIVEAPALVALAVDEVIRAVHTGGPLRFDPARLAAAEGRLLDSTPCSCRRGEG